MDRRTLALGVTAAGAVTAVVVVALPSHGSATRASVVAYIKSADAVQQQMAYPMTKVLTAYHAFASSRAITPGVDGQLAQAERTLSTLARRLAAVDAPPAARHLRALLLRLVALETRITGEVETFARFAPRFARALQQARRASVLLGRQLAVVKPPTPHLIHGTRKTITAAQAAFAAAASTAAASQADAIAVYDLSVAAVLRQLAPLSPPQALAPAYRSEVQGLEATYAAGERLAAALRSSNRSDVATLGRAFTLASRSSRSVQAQRAEIAAVEAYDARVRELSTAAGAVQNEFLHLQATVG